MKMVLVVRADLGMSKGKIAAQCGHACIAAYERSERDAVARWKAVGQPKIALKCADEDELLALYTKCRANGIAAAVIRDAGHTQVPAGSTTALGIGPAPADAIDVVTGRLRLL